jgi:hypothetical protein
LNPGVYWVEVQLDGTLASGPWCPPITINGETTTGNALQNVAGIWGPFEDSGILTPQGMPFLIEGSGGGGGSVPAGLLSFNLYESGGFIANVPYNGEGTEDWILYVDNNLMPGCYTYDVTALYDLTVFGFPGEIGESAKEGPHEVCIVWGLDLPFCEDFAQGYQFNGWMVNDANWTINSQVGNAAPSAQWNWDPDPGTPYMSTLTSPPMNADMLTEGRIWLDFDLALNNRNATGEEMMKVEVYNGSSWHTVATFDNEDGSFAFTGNHVEITNDAIDGVFMVRFNATGENSFDVIAWNLDNVCLYRTCDAPFNLTGEYAWNASDDFGAEVCWEVDIDEGPVTEWISYNDGTFENGFCSTDGGAGLAQLFTPTAYPVTITEVRYFNDSYGSPGQENHIYVLSGDGATVLAGPYPVIGEAGDTWVTVDIDDVTLAEGTFMVYTENQLPDGPFVGVDDSFYDGSLYFGAVGDFTELGEYGYNYVGSHEAYVSYEAAAGSVQNSVLLAPGVGQQQFNIAVSNHSSGVSVQRPAERALAHFNVYRSMEGADDYMMVGQVMAEEGVTEYCYFDTEVDIQTGYCYKVTAVYMSEEDECESDFAMDVAEEFDYVCVFITDVENPEALTTNLYPNPTRDQVTITASAEMTRLTVINYVGQVVMDSEMNQSTYVLNTSNFESGVYVVRIETESEVITKRFAVAR